LEPLFATRSDLNKVALFLKYGTADKKTVAIVINEENSSGKTRVFHQRSEAKSNKIVIALSTDLHRIQNAAIVALDNSAAPVERCSVHLMQR
ncbi:hypothetical protein Q8G41_27475, partial [Klebsiella pneumoniae]|uniref:hypothetical protein n=1 Tax=Klebsiella pneumoniae TaxID=573 RepID=UPI003013D7CD